MDQQTLPPFTLEPPETVSQRWDRWLRRFANFLTAKEVTDDGVKKAMLLHFAGEKVFDLSESLGVVDNDSYDQTKDKLNAYFTPQKNVEYEIFKFRQAKQNSEDRKSTRLNSSH